MPVRVITSTGGECIPEESHGSGGVDVAAAALRLGISPTAVRKRVRRGSLRAYKVSGEWRIVLPAPGVPADVPPGYPMGQDAGRAAGYPAGATQQTVGQPAGQAAEGSVVLPAEDIVAVLQAEVTALRQLMAGQAQTLTAQAQALADLAQTVRDQAATTATLALRPTTAPDSAGGTQTLPLSVPRAGEAPVSRGNRSRSTVRWRVWLAQWWPR